MFTTNAIIVFIAGIIIIAMCMEESLALNISFALPGKSKTKIRLKYLVILAFFLFVGVCVTDSYDISFYRDAYVRRISHGKEPLFDYLTFFCYDRGIGFDQFKTVWLVVITALLYRGIKLYCKKPEQVVAMLFFTGLLSFITQMRSAMAMAIIVNFIPLLYTGKMRDRFKYGVIVILCGQMHIVSYAFLLFLIVKAKGRRIYQKEYYVVLAIVTLLAVGMNAFFISILTAIMGRIPGIAPIANRIIASVSGVGTPIKASLFLIFQQVCLYVFTARACDLQTGENAADSTCVGVIREINTLSLVYLPLCVLNASFNRLFVLIAIMQYGMILNVGRKRVGISKWATVNVSMKTALFCLAIFLFLANVHSNPDDFVRIMNSIQF